MSREIFESIVQSLAGACQAYYGDRLVTIAIFGSVARGTMRPDSDIDLLIIARDLPSGRLPRVREFDDVESELEDVMKAASDRGIHACLSPIIKTPNEVNQGSPLFLDMTDQARILFDRDNFFFTYLEDLAARLRKSGAHRVYRGGGYYWKLRPGLKAGEEIFL